MSSIREEIAKNILFYRKRAGLTQAELAEKLGVKNTSVSNWEKGNNSIDIETLLLASEIFGVSLPDMYGKYGKTSTDLFSTVEYELLKDYRSLNDEGKHKVFSYVKDIVSTGKYSKKDSASELSASS